MTGFLIDLAARPLPVGGVLRKCLELLFVFRPQGIQRLLVPFGFGKRIGTLGLDNKLVLQLVDPARLLADIEKIFVRFGPDEGFRRHLDGFGRLRLHSRRHHFFGTYL